MYGQRDPHHPNLRQKLGEVVIRCGCGHFVVVGTNRKEVADAWHKHAESDGELNAKQTT